MTIVLITRRKLGFVLGTLKEPVDKSTEEDKAWVTYHGIIH